MTTATGRPGLRERQRQETHLLIRRTAFDLTLERGAAAVSVKNICDAAGVSARTFFNHFRTKDEALIPDLPDFSPDARQAFEQSSEPDLVAALEQLLRGYVVCLKEESGHPVGSKAMKPLLEANPELLPRLLAVFEANERQLAELVARRTGRRSDDLFCVVAALTAAATMRAAYSAVVTHTPDVIDLDSPNQAVLSEQLEISIHEAFSALRQLATPEPAGIRHSST
jgi:AcrR family transcriptional regulator